MQSNTFKSMLQHNLKDFWGSAFNAIPLDQIKSSAIGAVKIGAFAFLAFGALKGQAKNVLMQKAQLALEKQKRKERMKAYRLRTAGPLARSSQHILHILKRVLKDGFFETNYHLDPMGSVSWVVYLVSCFLYWRFNMEKGLIMEVIVADDYWQFSVDHAINEVMKASQTPTELRISAFQARAIAELMAGTNVSDKAHGMVTVPVDFTVFSERLAKCMKAKQGECIEADFNVGLWRQWFEPLVESMSRYARLMSTIPRGGPTETLTDLPEAMEYADRLFVIQTNIKFVAIQRELVDLTYVLEKNPADKWFQEKRIQKDVVPSSPKDLHVEVLWADP